MKGKNCIVCGREWKVEGSIEKPYLKTTTGATIKSYCILCGRYKADTFCVISLSDPQTNREQLIRMLKTIEEDAGEAVLDQIAQLIADRFIFDSWQGA